LASKKKNTKPRNKGVYIGAYVDNSHIDKIAAVEEEFGKLIGAAAGGHRSRAIRYIVECFDPAWLKDFPKSQAPVNATAQMG
jgi:hypothetical protein